MIDSGKPVTIQATGKLYKALAVVGVVLIIVGIVIHIVARSANESTLTGSSVLFAGLFTYIGARILAWWHHA